MCWVTQPWRGALCRACPQIRSGRKGERGESCWEMEYSILLWAQKTLRTWWTVPLNPGFSNNKPPFSPLTGLLLSVLCSWETPNLPGLLLMYFRELVIFPARGMTLWFLETRQVSTPISYSSFMGKKGLDDQLTWLPYPVLYLRILVSLHQK